jgi:solute carrier family 36 (proton-coupled amino acid transporter)
MSIGLIITLYDSIIGLNITDRPLHISIWGIPSFCGIAIFAMDAIGVVMPLVHSMKNPSEMMGTFGVLNLGMAFATLLNGLVGFFGYARYGSEALRIVTLNPPVHHVHAQVEKILIAVAIFLTTALQFYVVLDVVWKEVEKKIKNHRCFYHFLIRTVLVTAIILLSLVFRTIGPMIELLGDFCNSIGGLLVPAFIETICYWNEGFGKWNWRFWKNILLFLFGLLSLVMGTKDMLEEINIHE